MISEVRQMKGTMTIGLLMPKLFDIDKTQEAALVASKEDLLRRKVE
jgi:hypothetical protein